MKREYIFNLILFFFSLEYLNVVDNISVFQVFILPLVVIGILLNPPIISKSGCYFLGYSGILLGAYLLANIKSDFLPALSFCTGIFLLLVYLTVYLSNYQINSNTIFIFSLYSFPHLAVLISYYFNGNLITSFTGSTSERFSGMHTDPNFMSVYVNIALLSKLIIVNKIPSSKRFLAFILWGFILLDILAIIFSFSRSGILILIIGLFVFYFLVNRKLFYRLLFVGSILSIYAYKLFNDLSYSVDMNALFNIFWRFKQSSSMGNFEDPRIDAYSNVYHLIESGQIGLLGLPLSNYVSAFSIYPHSSFLDIIVTSGIFLGALTVMFIIYFIIRSFKNISVNLVSKWLFLVVFLSFLSFGFLSMYQQKLFWLMSVFLFYSAFTSAHLMKKKFSNE